MITEELLKWIAGAEGLAIIGLAAYIAYLIKGANDRQILIDAREAGHAETIREITETYAKDMRQIAVENTKVIQNNTNALDRALDRIERRKG